MTSERYASIGCSRSKLSAMVGRTWESAPIHESRHTTRKVGVLGSPHSSGPTPMSAPDSWGSDLSRQRVIGLPELLAHVCQSLIHCRRGASFDDAFSILDFDDGDVAAVLCVFAGVKHLERDLLPATVCVLSDASKAVTWYVSDIPSSFSMRLMMSVVSNASATPFYGHPLGCIVPASLCRYTWG